MNRKTGDVMISDELKELIQKENKNSIELLLKKIKNVNCEGEFEEMIKEHLIMRLQGMKNEEYVKILSDSLYFK